MYKPGVETKDAGDIEGRPGCGKSDVYRARMYVCDAARCDDGSKGARYKWGGRATGDYNNSPSKRL